MMNTESKHDDSNYNNNNYSYNYNISKDNKNNKNWVNVNILRHVAVFFQMARDFYKIPCNVNMCAKDQWECSNEDKGLLFCHINR